jgi:antitoxin component of MazEF toxin-antitoxin module
VAKLIKAGDSFRVTIPRDLARLLGWSDKTTVAVHLHEKDMVLIEKLDDPVGE